MRPSRCQRVRFPSPYSSQVGWPGPGGRCYKQMAGREPPARLHSFRPPAGSGLSGRDFKILRQGPHGCGWHTRRPLRNGRLVPKNDALYDSGNHPRHDGLNKKGFLKLTEQGSCCPKSLWGNMDIFSLFTTLIQFNEKSLFAEMRLMLTTQRASDRSVFRKA